VHTALLKIMQRAQSIMKNNAALQTALLKIMQRAVTNIISNNASSSP
jgi:hypothetical protein